MLASFKSKIWNVFCPAIFLHFCMVWYQSQYTLVNSLESDHTNYLNFIFIMILRPQWSIFEKIEFEIEAFVLEKQCWNPAKWQRTESLKTRQKWRFHDNFCQFLQKSGFHQVSKYFLNPKWYKKNLISIFLQNTFLKSYTSC